MVFNQIIKTRIAYGTYDLSLVYDINQIIQNPEIRLFKCYLNKEILIFIIISEENLLLFHPKENNQSNAQLVLIVDLTSINIFKGKSLFDKMEATLGVELPFHNMKYIELNFKLQEKLNILISLISSRKDRLVDGFTISHTDYIFIRDTDSQQFLDKAFFIKNNIIKISQSFNLKQKEDLSLPKRNNSDSNLFSSLIDSESINESRRKTNTLTSTKSTNISKEHIMTTTNKHMEEVNHLLVLLSYKLEIVNKNNEYSVYLVKEIIFIYQKLISLNSEFSNQHKQKQFILELKGFLESSKIKENILLNN